MTADWVEEKGWKALEGGGALGEARVRVDFGAPGQETWGLVFRFVDPRQAERVRWVHQPQRGAQLFAIPEVLDVGEDWYLLSDIAGMPLTNLASGRSALMEEMGNLLRKLHEVDSPDLYGDILSTPAPASEVEPVRAQRQWHTFNGYVAAHLDYFSDRINSGVFSDDVRTALLEVVGDLRHELSAFLPRQPAALHHGSFGPKHLWVDVSTGKIVGLTGFENAALLPPGMDIAYLFYIVGLLKNEDAVHAFYRGYGAARTMDVQRREKFYGRLVLLEALFGLRDGLGATEDRLVEAVCERSPL
ncbi:MAG: phosphotransferase family protein [Bradymonadaceae bacterium]